LVNLGKSHLKVGAVCKVSVTGDHALHATTEIGLAIESLFNRLDGKVSVSAISNFPESDLRITSKVNVLGAIGDELH